MEQEGGSHAGAGEDSRARQALVQRWTDSTMVVGDYMHRRLSPLRRRGHLACFYSGPKDVTRTFVGGNNSSGSFFLFFLGSLSCF